jgi:uncharacterized protein (DUF2267 family)
LDWIYSLEDLLNLPDNHETKTFSIMRSVFHALRDHFPHGTLAHVGQQLPIFLRGVWFEGWDPAHTPIKERKKEDFIKAVKKHLESYADLDIEHCAQITMHFLSSKLSDGEGEKVYKVLPESIAVLWKGTL